MATDNKADKATQTVPGNPAVKKGNSAEKWDADRAARTELHAAHDASPFPAVVGDEAFNMWAEQVAAEPGYRLRDERGNAVEPPQIITQVGPGPNDYIVTRFENGQILVQDARDATGRTWHYPQDNWRRYIARVNGEEIPADLVDGPQDGLTMHEAAAEQNARTAQLVEQDRKRTEQARQDANS